MQKNTKTPAWTPHVYPPRPFWTPGGSVTFWDHVGKVSLYLAKFPIGTILCGTDVNSVFVIPVSYIGTIQSGAVVN